ncbi:hypothetical protein PFISCL1PPCAC_28403, partial [Pristionchus fissidentatus]
MLILLRSGYFFGTIIFGLGSDIRGRKRVASFALALGLTATIATGFLVYFFTKTANYSSCKGLIRNQRMFMRAYFNWGFSRMLLTGICYLTQEWRMASFGIALVASPALVAMLFIFPESPTWLLSKNRLEEMSASERKIARIAGVEYVPALHPRQGKPKSLRDVMRGGMWKRLVVLWVMWLTAATSAYATDLASSTISGDLYLNQFLFGLVIYMSKVILGIVDARCEAFSRRMLHQGSQFGAILCFGLLAVFKLTGYAGPLYLIFNLLGIVFVEYTCDAGHLCAVESMETASRASAMGSSSFIARIGMLTSPMV